MYYFTFLQSSFMSGWIRDSWILLSVSAFSMLRYSVLVEVLNIWRKSVLTQICSWKRKEYFNIFLNNCEYSLMMLHQNVLSSSFLKFSCNVELETISMSFLYSVKFNSIGITCTLTILCIHCSLFHWVMQIFQILTLFIVKVASLISPSISSEKILCIEKLSNWQWLIKVSQNSNFSSKSQILSLTTITISCFLWSDRLT